MLRTISITNYALIDELNLRFEDRLNIITGETGAGKSILLGALGLLLGQRADSGALFDKTKKCVIEGEYTSISENVNSFLKANELDEEDRLIVRREITKEGKSRAFINDTPVSLNQLREVGELLVDIHSQHETLLLNKSSFQLSVVDAFSGNEDDVKQFRKEFKKYKVLISEIEELKLKQQSASAEFDYLNYQFNELEDASLVSGEDKQLEEELSSLNHAEEIKTGTAQINAALSSGDENITAGLQRISQLTSSLSKFHSRFSELNERVKSVLAEIQDIDFEAGKISEDILPDPKRQEIVTARLDVIYRLENKHRVKSADELIVLKESFSEKLSGINSYSEKIEALAAEINALEKQLNKLADKISKKRKGVVTELEEKIMKLLKSLALTNAVFKIDITANDELNEYGKDNVRFLFSANKGVNIAEISKVASGGELSRLMLCLKAVVAKNIELPTMIFDEIDTGVSGETAFKIGKVLQELSLSHQLITITHSPQIASRGNDHYFVFKEVIGKKTVTNVRKLSSDDRIIEIAQMLSGAKPSAVAMENAKELLKN